MAAINSASSKAAPNRRHLRLELTPPLKWAGGKRWLIPHLQPIWNKHEEKRLIEPFCGGLAVALGLRPDKALLNDINPHAINFYRCLKKGLSRKIDLRNDEELYYSLRERFNELIKQKRDETRESAELFYYLNRTGYNGLCRFNKSGFFNVPFGKYKTINYNNDFSSFINAFRHWDFECGDFSLLSKSPRDLIYADPPYDVEFTQYSREGFSWKDQKRLAEWLSAHRGPVIASNQATPRIIELYRDLGFKIEILAAPRMISCTGDRSKAKEILATKNLR